MTWLSAWWLSRMLQAVEAGEQWPQQLTQARAIFLPSSRRGAGTPSNIDS